ncbi:MAG: hypothetical protein ACHQWU_09505, partial [Gemmatimonadales bacterium]
SRAAPTAALVAMAIGLARAASAQDTTSATRPPAPPADTVVACAGQRIDSIIVHTSAPTAALLRRVPIVARMVAAVHTTTHRDLIRRFMLLNVGDACDELRLAESARIIREQPFIADADVLVFPSAAGGVNLDVETSDEVALVLGVSAAAGIPPVRVLRLGDANLSGEGIYLSGDWRDGGPFRDGFGGRFSDNQLLGRPYTFTVDGHQDPLGDSWQVNATHPFYTDIQRIAWRARAGARDGYVQYSIDQNTAHALRLARNFFDVGGIVRVGPPGRLSLFGASVSGNDERPATLPVLITNRGFAPDTGTELLGRFKPHRIARVNVLWGVRDIGYTRVRGFDALTATQDLPVGFELGTLFGRSLSVLGSRDDDIFMSGDVYLGAAQRNLGLRLQLEGEGRRDNGAGQWDGVLTSGNSVVYFRPGENNTMSGSLEFSGGWHQRIPFNLSLSDPTGGLRGYISSRTPGSQRLVARWEDRQFVGQPYKLGDLGVGVFAETGRLWAGDIPYGVTTPLRSSFGVSLYGAVPPASARLWRLDLAIAADPAPGGHRLELRLSNMDRTTFFLAEPADIGATREQTVPSSVFRWP